MIVPLAGQAQPLAERAWVVDTGVWAGAVVATGAGVVTGLTGGLTGTVETTTEGEDAAGVAFCVGRCDAAEGLLALATAWDALPSKRMICPG